MKSRYLIFQIISVIDGWVISCELALRWISLDLTDDKSTLVQVMAWCRQATSHYLSQCWPISLCRHMPSLGPNELTYRGHCIILVKLGQYHFLISQGHPQQHIIWKTCFFYSRKYMTNMYHLNVKKWYIYKYILCLFKTIECINNLYSHFPEDVPQQAGGGYKDEPHPEQTAPIHILSLQETTGNTYFFILFLNTYLLFNLDCALALGCDSHLKGDKVPLVWHCPQVNATRPHWGFVNTD